MRNAGSRITEEVEISGSRIIFSIITLIILKHEKEVFPPFFEQPKEMEIKRFQDRNKGFRLGNYVPKN
jgi:hypothetical protein